jgi:nitrate/nitrite-specific signal transduction histidine kinase
MVERTQLIEAELDTLYLISQVLNSTHDLHEKLQVILEILHKRSGMRSGMITLKEIENNSMIVSVVHTNGTGNFTGPYSMKVALSLLKECLKNLVFWVVWGCMIPNCLLLAHLFI